MSRYLYEIGTRVCVDEDRLGFSYKAEVRSYSANGVWVRLDDGSRRRVAWWRLTRV